MLPADSARLRLLPCPAQPQHDFRTQSTVRCLQNLSTNVEYLNSRDATIMGSRNGHAPLYLWYTLTKKGYEGMRRDVERCLRNAHLLKVRA